MTPEVVIVSMLQNTCPLCASTGELPSWEESDDLGGLDWN